MSEAYNSVAVFVFFRVQKNRRTQAGERVSYPPWSAFLFPTTFLCRSEESRCYFNRLGVSWDASSEWIWQTNSLFELSFEANVVLTAAHSNVTCLILNARVLDDDDVSAHIVCCAVG